MGGINIKIKVLPKSSSIIRNEKPTRCENVKKNMQRFTIELLPQHFYIRFDANQKHSEKVFRCLNFFFGDIIKCLMNSGTIRTI